MSPVSVWPTSDGLIAVPVRDGITGDPVAFGRSLDNAWELLVRLDCDLGLDWSLVLPDDLARFRPLLEAARHRRIAVSFVANDLVKDLRYAACLAHAPPLRTARLLARLPACWTLRPFLRSQAPPPRPSHEG